MTRSFLVHTLWSLDDRVALAHPPGYAGNVSVTGVLDAAGTATALPVAAVALAALAAAARAHHRGHPLAAVLAVGVAAPLVSPWSWDHHHVFVLPALLYLATAPGSRPRRILVLALAAAVVGLRCCPDDAARLGLLTVAAAVLGLLATAGDAVRTGRELAA